MQSVLSILENKVAPMAMKIQNNRYIAAIMSALMSILPITIIGSLFSLLGALPIDAYQNFLTNSGLKDIFTFAYNCTTNLFSLYAVFFVAKAITSSRKCDGNSAGAIAIATFMLITPWELGVDGSTNVIPATWLGAQGLFTALLVGIVTGELYSYITNKKIVIKMPEGTPETIQNSFSALLPGIIISLLFCAVRYGFQCTSYGDLHAFIYAIISKPLSMLTDNFISFLLVNIFMNVLWMFGIHGAMVGLSVMLPFWLQTDIVNQQLFAAGENLQNVAGMAFWNSYGTINYVGLVIFMAFLAKSKRYRMLGKMALPASVCGINEPTLFGIPMVLNPVFFIPMIFIPLLEFAIAFGLQELHILAIPAGFYLPLGTPVILSGFMQGSWTIALMQAIFIVLSAVLYYPFFRIVDKKAQQEEQAGSPAIE